jgi:hypothetical protein
LVAAPTAIARAAEPGEVDRPVAEHVELVPRGDDGHGRLRGAVQRLDDDVARRGHLRLADREVDHVHPSRTASSIPATISGQLRRADPGGRNRQHAIVAG